MYLSYESLMAILYNCNNKNFDTGSRIIDHRIRNYDDGCDELLHTRACPYRPTRLRRRSSVQTIVVVAPRSRRGMWESRTYGAEARNVEEHQNGGLMGTRRPSHGSLPRQNLRRCSECGNMSLMSQHCLREDLLADLESLKLGELRQEYPISRGETLLWCTTIKNYCPTPRCYHIRQLQEGKALDKVMSISLFAFPFLHRRLSQGSTISQRATSGVLRPASRYKAPIPTSIPTIPFKLLT